MAREDSIAQSILELVGSDNVASANYCMTRLRLEPKKLEGIDQNKLRKVDGVKGVVQTGNQLQIIFGPGLAERVTRAVAGKVGIYVGEVQADAGNTPAAMGGVQGFLKKVANIFLPLLPAILGTGLILGLTNFFVKINWIGPKTMVAGIPILALLGVLGGTFLGFIHILVAMNASREWGGPPAIGALAGMLLIAPALADKAGLNMTPARGGIIGALIAGAFLGWLYKQINKRMPDTITVMFTPFVTVLIGGTIILFLIQPIGFYASKWIADGVRGLLTFGGPIGSIISGAVLAGTFLPMVMLGIHQGTVPIHFELIKSMGNTPLLPILAMAGAGQVGAAFAVYFKTKDKELRQIIVGALPVGILGIGEPLIYGVTLPLGRPFIAACLGGAVGGAFIALTHIGSVALCVSGVLLAFLATNPLIYLLGVAISYVAGFAFSYAMGFDEKLAQNSQTFSFTAD